MNAPFKRVIIESPFAPRDGVSTEEHIAYAQRCMLDSILKGEAPFASHLLYTGCLDDTDPTQRSLGLAVASSYYCSAVARAVIVYTDYGISRGMQLGIKQGLQAHLPIMYRSIGRNGTREPVEPTPPTRRLAFAA